MTIKDAVWRWSYELRYIFLKDKISHTLSRLFHSVTMDGKYEFLKKSVPNFKLRNFVNVSCSVCTSNSGDIIEKILGRFVFN